jgi:hypothetical protein
MMVLLDTNALTLPYQFKIDLVGEIRKLVPDAQLVTLSQVVGELKHISDRAAGKFALEIINKEGIRVVESTGPADAALLRYASENGAALCTNDIALKKACKEKGVRVIFMRKKRILEMG